MTDGEISTLPNGKPAGSAKPLNRMLKVLVEHQVATLSEALVMASQVPARELGLRKGRLQAGFDADLAVLDGDFRAILTIVAGEVVFEAEGMHVI